MSNSIHNSPFIFITPTAILLSKRLIRKMNISNGDSLAPYLGLNYPYENHEAIQVWIQQILTTNQRHELLLEMLQSRLVSTVPTYLQGEIEF